MDLNGYPKEMRHPAYVPAVLSGYRGRGKNTQDDPPGSPVRFPPVFVNNPDQEQYYASMGYLPPGLAPNSPEAASYLAQTIGDDRPGRPYEHQQYPKWVYTLDDDLQLKSALVDDEQAEEQLGSGWSDDLAGVKQLQAEEQHRRDHPEVVPPPKHQAKQAGKRG